MKIFSAVLYIDKCAACGKHHDNLEVMYVNPPVEMDGEVYDMVTICKTTGDRIYVRMNTRKEDEHDKTTDRQ